MTGFFFYVHFQCVMCRLKINVKIFFVRYCGIGKWAYICPINFTKKENTMKHEKVSDFETAFAEWNEAFERLSNAEALVSRGVVDDDSLNLQASLREADDKLTKTETK